MRLRVDLVGERVNSYGEGPLYNSVDIRKSKFLRKDALSLELW